MSSIPCSVMEPIPPPPLATNDLSSGSSSSTDDEMENGIRPHRNQRHTRIRSSPPAGSPLFRSLRRSRLWTADTIPIQNTSPAVARAAPQYPKLKLNRSYSSSGCTDTSKAAFRVTPEDPCSSPYSYRMRSDVNPFVTFDDDSNGSPLLSPPPYMDIDEQSTFSSVSNDSARRYPAAPPGAATIHAEHVNRAPPAVIFIRHKPSRDGQSDDSVKEVSNEATSFPVSSWQKTWVEGGAVACCTADSTASTHSNSPSDDAKQVTRPSPLVTSSRSQSYNTDATDPANYRLHAPRNMVVYDDAAPLVSPTFTRSKLDNSLVALQERHVVESMEDLSLSPKHKNSSLIRAVTDTGITSPTAPCSTPKHRRRVSGIPLSAMTSMSPTSATTSAVFRPLMKRACTTTNASTPTSTTMLLQKPRLLQARHQTTTAMDANSSVTSSLLGDRPRRKPVQGSESVFSIGSIVGESSLLTPNPVSYGGSDGSKVHASPTTVKEFEQLVKANKRLNQHVTQDDATVFIPPASRRRKSGLHQDFDYMWKQVRRLTGATGTGTGAGQLDLQRNRDGCLT